MTVSFAPGESDQFVTCGADATVRVWGGADYGVMAATREADAGHPQSLAQSSDILVVGWEDGSARAYGSETCEALWTLPRAHAGGVTAAALAANERFVVTGGEDGGVRVWELRSREMICDLREHAARVTGLALFRDDAHAISVSRDRSMVCWDLRRERRVSSHVQRLGGISAVALSRDQSVVITGGLSKAISLWDLREPQPVQVLSPAHGDDEVTALAVFSGSELLASGGADGAVKLWDLRSGRAVASGVGHSARVRGVAASGDGRQVVSVGDDGCVFVWNVFGAES